MNFEKGNVNDANDRNMERTEVKLGIISDIISQEFIEENCYGVCLPCALLFYKQACKFQLRPALKCGKMRYKDNRREAVVSVHFWNEFNGKQYDPTRKITKEWNPMVDIKNYLFYADEQKVYTIEDQLLMMCYYTFLAMGNGNQYFASAPNYLLRLKHRVEKRVNKI